MFFMPVVLLQYFIVFVEPYLYQHLDVVKGCCHAYQCINCFINLQDFNKFLINVCELLPYVRYGLLVLRSSSDCF